MVDPRLRAAVDASLSSYVDQFAMHDVPAVLSDGVFRALAHPPPFHSTALTVEPGLTGDLLRRLILEGPLPGVADNFCDQDLSDVGLTVLFSATWLHRPAAVATMPPGWGRVSSRAALTVWNAAGDTTGVLLPAVLYRATYAVLEQRDADGVVAGCVARLGSGHVYLSNVHAAPGHRCDWDQVVDAVTATFPDRPILGYEHGGDLACARDVGFEAIGDKRVWVSHPQPVDRAQSPIP